MMIMMPLCPLSLDRKHKHPSSTGDERCLSRCHPGSGSLRRPMWRAHHDSALMLPVSGERPATLLTWAARGGRVRAAPYGSIRLIVATALPPLRGSLPPAAPWRRPGCRSRRMRRGACPKPPKSGTLPGHRPMRLWTDYNMGSWGWQAVFWTARVIRRWGSASSSRTRYPPYTRPRVGFGEYPRR